jgi:polysaccharide export outer membrane protein
VVAIVVAGCVVQTIPAASQSVEPAFGFGDYRLGPEDVIDVFVWKEPDITTSVSIRPDGKVSLPLSGELHAEGKTPLELEGEVRARLERYITDPIVTVIVREVNSARISVLGEVDSPNVFPIKARISALDAIAMAGGFTEFADRGDVIVLREGASGTERIRLDLKRLIDDQAPDVFYLEPKDVVYVK